MHRTTATQRNGSSDAGNSLCNGGEMKAPAFIENSDSEERNDEEGRMRRPRISYAKEFLLECSNSPIAKRKPADFPLPDLGCTLSAIKSSKSANTPVFPPVYIPPRRKDELGGHREPGDNISLRPHSGNFAFGCREPRHYRDGREADRDRERHYREDGERGRHRDDRDVDRERRERPTRNNRMDDQNRWGDADGAWDDQHPHHEGKWNHAHHGLKNGRGDGPNGPGHFERTGHHRDSHYHKRNDFEKEPEWFSGGPTSRHETMELRGFMDDNRQDKSDDKGTPKKNEMEARRRNEPPARSEEADGETDKATGELNLSLEKILKMEKIPGLENNAPIDQDAENSYKYGKSRFSQIFQRNSSSATTLPPKEEQVSHLVEKLSVAPPSNPITTNSNRETDGKKDIAQELGNALRNMLQINPNERKTAKEEVKPLVQGPVVPPESSAAAPSVPKRDPAPPAAVKEEIRLPHMHKTQPPPNNIPSTPNLLPITKDGLQALLQNLLISSAKDYPPQQPQQQQGGQHGPIGRPPSAQGRPDSGLGRPIANGMPAFEMQQCNQFPGSIRPDQFTMGQNMMGPPNAIQMVHGMHGRPIANGMPAFEMQQCNQFPGSIRPDQFTMGQYMMRPPNAIQMVNGVQTMHGPIGQPSPAQGRPDSGLGRPVANGMPVFEMQQCNQFPGSIRPDQFTMGQNMMRPPNAIQMVNGNFRPVHRVPMPIGPPSQHPQVSSYNVIENLVRPNLPPPHHNMMHNMFTPTSVMRTMTAESPKPSNPNNRRTPNFFR